MELEDRSTSKLTWNKVKEIRRMYDIGYTQTKLAERFGVSTTCIYKIIHNKSWKQSSVKEWVRSLTTINGRNI